MRKKQIIPAILCCLLALSHSALSADILFRADLASRYIWRGFDLNPYKKPVFQPSVEYAFGNSGFYMNLWMSFSFENKELNETNLTLAYTHRFSEDFSLETGLIHYGWYLTPNFRFENDTSHEVYIALGMPEILLRPRFTLFYDFTNGDGFYALLETGHSFDIAGSLEAGIKASIGFNGGQWLAERTDAGFSDCNIGLFLPYEWNDLRIIPFLNYTVVLLDAIGKGNHFWFGISLAYELRK